MALKRKNVGRGIGFNMTPMIDVVFLLIIFFMVVSQVVSSEMELMNLPHPFRSQAVELTSREKLTLSLVGNGAGGISRIKVGGNPVHSDASLLQLLVESGRSAKARRAELQIVLRADKDIQFRHVRRVMGVIAESGLEFLGIGAEIEATGER
jgi:biopolymer transport protein ExbD